VNLRGGPRSRPLEADEIRQIGALFGQAARRARLAGFDLVEFHIGTGNLLSQFVCPATNRRSDQYGGGLEDRMRFVLEVMAETRRMAGDGFPMMIRVSGADMIDGGHTEDDTAQVAAILERAGAAAIDVATGWPESTVLLSKLGASGSRTYLAERIKDGHHPGGDRDASKTHCWPAHPRRGRADMVTMARA
jgi:2,4-dienoyl-CoA reductase-like NADH-dependent reductase (Old Yellow Enzyme family)